MLKHYVGDTNMNVFKDFDSLRTCVVQSRRWKLVSCVVIINSGTEALIFTFSDSLVLNFTLGNYLLATFLKGLLN